MELAKGKAGGIGITKVPRECAFWRGFWQGPDIISVRGRDAPATAAGTLRLRSGQALALRFGGTLLYEFLQILPVDEDDVVFFQRLFEFWAGDHVVIALAPG